MFLDFETVLSLLCNLVFALFQSDRLQCGKADHLSYYLRAIFQTNVLVTASINCVNTLTLFSKAYLSGAFLCVSKWGFGVKSIYMHWQWSIFYNFLLSFNCDIAFGFYCFNLSFFIKTHSINKSFGQYIFRSLCLIASMLNGKVYRHISPHTITNFLFFLQAAL